MPKRSKSGKSNRSNKKFKPDASQLKAAESNQREELSSSALSGEGRLVWNHSTHLQGLIPKLKKLCKQPGIHTITPAVLGRARSNAPKLMLKVSVPIRGGYKLIARNGKSFQEVFVITSLDKDGLETAIAHALG